MKKILYITYDSLNDSISKSQVKPLLNNLTNNYKVFLISFEKKDNREKIKHINIWKKFKYKNSKLSKFGLILKCFFFTLTLVKKHKIEIIHCRSYIPGIIAYYIKKFTGVKYIFDIRGFWFDEKKDAKLISFILYKILKLIEKKIYTSADFVITLSKKSINHINQIFNVKKRKIEHVTCFTNLNKFTKNSKNLSKEIIFGYVGNIGLSYDFQKVLLFLKIYNKYNKNWKLIFINNYLNKREKSDLFKTFPHKSKIKIYSSEYKNINYMYKKINYGIYFLKNDFSKTASCPTKLGEMLGSGVPVITNGQIGDIEFFINGKKKCGFVINKVSDKNLYKLSKIIKNKKNYLRMKKNAVYIAKKYFEQNKVLLTYNNIYQKLI